MSGTQVVDNETEEELLDKMADLLIDMWLEEDNLESNDKVENDEDSPTKT